MYLPFFGYLLFLSHGLVMTQVQVFMVPDPFAGSACFPVLGSRLAVIGTRSVTPRPILALLCSDVRLVMLLG